MIPIKHYKIKWKKTKIVDVDVVKAAKNKNLRGLITTIRKEAKEVFSSLSEEVKEEEEGEGEDLLDNFERDYRRIE